jgi:hypothetical protein
MFAGLTPTRAPLERSSHLRNADHGRMPRDTAAITARSIWWDARR